MRRNSLLILSALVMLMAACGKKGGKTGLLVPKDAAIVVHVNSSSLSSKLTWDEISQTNWFKGISKETTDSTAQQLLSNPASSGIDTKEDLVFFIKKQGKGGYLVFEGGLSDAAAFEKLVKNMTKENPQEVKKDGDFNYMPMASDDKGLVLWNKSRFAFVANAPLGDMAGDFGGRRSEPHEFSNDSLRSFGQQTLTLKSTDNLDTDSRFADLVKDGSDIHMWFNSQGYYGDLGGGMMSMMKLNLLFEGNVSAMSMNFDNGKITAKSKSYYNDELSKLIANNKPENLSTDMLNRIPSSNVAGVIAFNYPPKGLHDLLKLIGVDGMANGFLADMNYSVEEFIKAVKGDVLLAVTDISMGGPKPDSGNYMAPPKPDLKVLFATSVNDKAAFEKMVTLAWEATKGMTGKMPPISYKLENNWFAASNSAEYTDKFLAGGKNKQPFVDKISGHPFGMYVDLNKIISAFGGFATDSAGKASFDLTLKTWQDIVAYGGEYKDKAIVADFEINLVDKNTNSLKQLNQYIDRMYTIGTEKRKKFAYNPDIEIKEVTLEELSPAPPPAK